MQNIRVRVDRVLGGLDCRPLTVGKSMVEICEFKERLYIFDLLRFCPIRDGMNLVGGHGEAFRKETVSKIFNRNNVELAFLSFAYNSCFQRHLRTL